MIPISENRCKSKPNGGKGSVQSDSRCLNELTRKVKGQRMNPFRLPDSALKKTNNSFV